MSAFLVQASTIQRIVEGISRGCNGHDRFFPPKNMRKSPLWAEDTDSRQALGQKLWGMNLRGLDERYGQEDSFYQDAADIVKQGYAPVGLADGLTATGLLKSINCLLYQCTEGLVPKLALYRALQGYADELAVYIVVGSSEYSAEPWD